MSVSDVSSIGMYVGLLSDILVANQACWLPTKRVGLQWGMLVSDGFPKKDVEVSDQACRSPMGLW